MSYDGTYDYPSDSQVSGEKWSVATNHGLDI